MRQLILINMTFGRCLASERANSLYERVHLRFYTFNRRGLVLPHVVAKVGPKITKY